MCFVQKYCDRRHLGGVRGKGYGGYVSVSSASSTVSSKCHTNCPRCMPDKTAKLNFGWGCSPDPTWGAYSVPHLLGRGQEKDLRSGKPLFLCQEYVVIAHCGRVVVELAERVRQQASDADDWRRPVTCRGRWKEQGTATEGLRNHGTAHAQVPGSNHWGWRGAGQVVCWRLVLSRYSVLWCVVIIYYSSIAVLHREPLKCIVLLSTRTLTCLERLLCMETGIITSELTYLSHDDILTASQSCDCGSAICQL